MTTTPIRPSARRFLSAHKVFSVVASKPVKAAERELEGRGVRVVLIRGEELVDVMIEHGVGVEPIKVATIHGINEDFFDEL